MLFLLSDSIDWFVLKYVSAVLTIIGKYQEPKSEFKWTWILTKLIFEILAVFFSKYDIIRLNLSSLHN